MTDTNFEIRADSLSKRFNKTLLFKGLSFSIKTGNSLSLTGPNGSGKSTLMQILAYIQKPTRGSVTFFQNEKKLEENDINRYIGFTSPLLNPYEELTGYENIYFVLRNKKDEAKILPLMEEFLLIKHKDKSLKYYSSGMKQRLKFICAVINDPPILFFDEPGTNLDRKGKDLIYSYIESVKKEKIIVIATNEEEEIRLCREDIKIAQ